MIGSVVSNSHQPLPSTVIEPLSFRGRTISSLRRPADSNRYVLLDAVCRLFFPQQHNVDGFIRAVETLFHIPDVRMSEVEEQQFISFYKLPTDRLRHNKLIRFDLLIDIFSRLEIMFSVDMGVAQGQVIGTVLSRSAVDSAATSATDGQTVQPTTSINNNNDVTRQKKRRRNHVSNDVVVID